MEGVINTHGLDDLIDHYLDRGMSADDVVKEVVDVLDSLVDFKPLGPAGEILEILDGPTILLIVTAIQKARGTPEQREARRVRREERKRERQERRAARRMERGND